MLTVNRLTEQAPHPELQGSIVELPRVLRGPVDPHEGVLDGGVEGAILKALDRVHCFHLYL